MFELKIENKYRDQLKLTNNPNYIVEATGLSPVTSEIITIKVANYSGERYVSSRQQSRNIVLNIYVNEPVEINRISLYNYIKSHDFIRVYYKNNSRDVYIDGYVESFELNHFEQTQTAQVSIICPQPNFLDVSDIEVSNINVIKGFYYPFDTVTNNIQFGEINEDGTIMINNTSDDDIGFIYQIHCRGEVINPFIYQTETNQYFKINKRFKADDVITIDTRRGKKSVIVTYRGVETNIINSVNDVSKWLQLQAGYNHITQGAESGAEYMDSTVIYTNEYEGV